MDDTLEYLRAYFNFFFAIDDFMVIIDIKLRFLTLSSFEVQFESIVNGLGGQN